VRIDPEGPERVVEVEDEERGEGVRVVERLGGRGRRRWGGRMRRGRFAGHRGLWSRGDVVICFIVRSLGAVMMVWSRGITNLCAGEAREISPFVYFVPVILLSSLKISLFPPPTRPFFFFFRGKIFSVSGGNICIHV
jgi:hypothetical protein